MKHIARATLIVLITLAALAILWQIRQVVVLFLLSVATAAAFRPLIAMLEGRGLPRGIALALAYALILGFAVGLLLLMSRPLLADLQNASNQGAILYDTLLSTWSAGSDVQRSIAAQLPSIQELTARFTGPQGTQSIQNIIGLSSNIFGFVGKLAMILILSVYWSADYLRFERLWLTLLPVASRPQARETYRAIEAGLGAYIRSEMVQSLFAGLLLWAGYQVMGLEYAVLLGLIGALAWLIPWFGALFAVVPPLVVALVTGGAPLTIIVVGYTLLVLFIQEWFIEPKFFTREVYSSVILVIMVLILAQEFGLIGLILAPLVSAAIQITLRYLVQPPVISQQPRMEASNVREDILALEERVKDVRASINADTPLEAISPEMANLTDRLSRLLTEAQDYLAKNSDIEKTRSGTEKPGELPLPGSVK